MNVFHEDPIVKRTYWRWLEKFGAGGFDLNDKSRSGRLPLIDDDFVSNSTEMGQLMSFYHCTIHICSLFTETIITLLSEILLRKVVYL